MEIKNLVQTCEACPSQWEGKTADNRAMYVRYRWGYLSISVSEPGGSIDDAVCAQEIYGKQHGDEYHGVMGNDELLPILASLPECSQLTPRAADAASLSSAETLGDNSRRG